MRKSNKAVVPSGMGMNTIQKLVYKATTCVAVMKQAYRIFQMIELIMRFTPTHYPRILRTLNLSHNFTSASEAVRRFTHIRED